MKVMKLSFFQHINKNIIFYHQSLIFIDPILKFLLFINVIFTSNIIPLIILILIEKMTLKLTIFV